MAKSGKKPVLKDIIRIDTELNKIQDLDLLLERILLEARKMLRADAGSIYVKEGQQLVIKYAQNDTKSKELPEGKKLIYSVFSVPINEKTISGYCAMTKKLVNVPDVYHIPEGAPFSYNNSFDKISKYVSHSNLTVPLVTADGRLLGVLQVLNALDENGTVVPFGSEAEMLITHFAANATVALQRASMTRAMILRMIKMSELRDPKETGSHVNRVAGYSTEIFERWAVRHGMKEVEREKRKDTLKIAAMLHDVGKVAISDIILKKPARFTPEEYKIMQGHTVHGAKLFEDPQSEIDKLSAEVALTHHENWDGSGYPGWIDPDNSVILKATEEGLPLGKKGEEIPLEGRIVALADVFDALVSKRVYKEAWDDEAVYEEIRKMRGNKFDPELVDIFFEILPNINQIRSMYPES